MIIDAQLTGNWTYFVGNFDGRSVQEYDLSTYSQNSVTTLANSINNMQHANVSMMVL